MENHNLRVGSINPMPYTIWLFNIAMENHHAINR